MIAEECPILDECSKVKMIFDCDLSFDALYAECIRKTCEKCDGQRSTISD
jgi:hypothetical protein